MLRRHITLTDEPGLGGVPIEPSSPRELELTNIDTAVSLWLHRIESQPDQLNRPPGRPDRSHELHQRIPVELCLQVTPIHRDAGVRLLLLGRLGQVFTDHRRLCGPDLIGSLAGSDTVLQLGMEMLGAYDLNLLWGSQHTHQRVGIGVRVLGVVIDSHLSPMAVTPVLLATAGLGQIVGTSP